MKERRNFSGHSVCNSYKNSIRYGPEVFEGITELVIVSSNEQKTFAL